MKEYFSKNEWEAIERVAEETALSIGISKDELISKLAHRQVAEKKSVVASYRVLKKYGWDKELVVDALETGRGEAGLDAIEKLADKLWIELGVYEVLEKEGATHPSNKDILPISLIKFLASRLLERMLAHDGKIPILLVFLIRDLLEVKRYGHNQVRAPHQEKLALFYFAETPNRSASEVAKLVGVDKATITRWLQDPAFNERADRLSANKHKLTYLSWALENGQFPLADWDD